MHIQNNCINKRIHQFNSVLYIYRWFWPVTPCEGVPTCNSSTKCQLRHKTRLHTRLPPRFLGMDAWMTSQLKLALICKLCGSLMCLAYFIWHVTQAMADIPPSGAGIKCLHCTSVSYIVWQNDSCVPLILQHTFSSSSRYNPEGAHNSIDKEPGHLQQ